MKNQKKRNTSSCDRHRKHYMTRIYVYNYLLFTFNYLEKQTETDPLIVAVGFPIFQLSFGILHSRISDFFTDFLFECRFQRIGRMNPTVRIQYVFRYVLSVNAIDRIADILSSGDDQTERAQH